MSRAIDACASGEAERYERLKGDRETDPYRGDVLSMALGCVGMLGDGGCGRPTIDLTIFYLAAIGQFGASAVN